MFEGRGPLAILLLVSRRRPRAESDAVRAADDSDQPRDHRRRRAGRIARPRIPARRRLRRARWRSSTACSASSSSSPPARSARSTRRRGSTSASRSCSSCSALAMFDVLADRLLELLERASGTGVEPRQRSSLAFSMGAVAALLAGACVAPVVIQVVLFSSNLYATGTTRRAGAAVLPRRRHGDSLADRRRRPRGAAEARACGWCASSRRSASSSSRRPRTTATRRTRFFANRWVDPSAVASSVAGTAEGRLARVARRGPRRPRSASRSRCSSTCGRRGARTA